MKSIRQKNSQSLGEVSGAVEIDAQQLSEIESGRHRPSEDLLMLLMSYFSIKDDDALRVLKLAGYERLESGADAKESGVQPVFVMPMDARVVYTDMANIVSNKYGIMINFLQSDGVGGQPLVASRVGMSRDHAQKLLNVLQRTLNDSHQRLLPAPSPKDGNSPKQ